MALMLFCFMVMMSRSSSSGWGTRPVAELNSWRLAPLKTMRCPFRHISPFFISNWRNPTPWAMVSVTAPFSSVTVRSISYKLGSSALHSLTFPTGMVSCPLPSERGKDALATSWFGSSSRLVMELPGNRYRGISNSDIWTVPLPCDFTSSFNSALV